MMCVPFRSSGSAWAEWRRCGGSVSILCQWNVQWDQGRSKRKQIVLIYWECPLNVYIFFHASFYVFLQLFVSESKNTSSRDVDNFFNFADMQMGLWSWCNGSAHLNVGSNFLGFVNFDTVKLNYLICDATDTV